MQDVANTGSVYSVVFTSLDAEPQRKHQKSKNNTMSNYLSVPKSENHIIAIKVKYSGFWNFGLLEGQVLFLDCRTFGLIFGFRLRTCSNHYEIAAPPNLQK